MRKIIFLVAMAFFVAICSTLWTKEAAGELVLEIRATDISLSGEWKFKLDPGNQGLQQGFNKLEYDDSRWDTIVVPGIWEAQGVTEKLPSGYDSSEPYDGYAWYRRWVVIPGNWKNYDLIINLGVIDDAATCFFNGFQIGETLNLDQDNIFSITSNLVKPGQANLLSVKVLDRGGEGGMVAGPLFIKPQFPWDNVTINLHTPKNAYLYFADQPVTFEVEVANPLKYKIKGQLYIRIKDFYSKSIYEKDFPFVIEPEKKFMQKVALPELEKGHYDIRIYLIKNGIRLKTKKSAIAVIEQPVKFTRPEKSPFALGGGALFHIPLEAHQTLGEVRLYQHQMVGAYWGRNDLWWGIIEDPKGKFNWEKADSTVNLFEKHNVNLLGILCYFSKWSNNTAPRNEKEVAEFVNYVKRIVSRYKGRVEYWEVWNEPNLAMFWAPQPNVKIYARLLQESYRAAKEVNPAVKIIGMVTAGTDLDFIEKVIQAGAGKAMDIISVHPYHGISPINWGKDTQLGKLVLLRHLLDKYGLKIPIWITECGWETRGRLNEKTQAEYLIKFYVKTLESKLVERIYWFNLSDWGQRDYTSGGHFGLVYSDQSPKPSYVAYRTMVDVLHDFNGVEKMKDLPAGVEGYKFTWEKSSTDFSAEGKFVYVLWSNKESIPVLLPEGVKYRIDIMGRKAQAKEKTIVVDTTPIFLSNFM